MAAGVRGTGRDVPHARSAGPRRCAAPRLDSTSRCGLEDALSEELVERDVATLVLVQRPPKTEPKPLSVDEVEVLLGHVAEHRLQAMFVVFALLGLRRSEVLGLQWTDIDLENGGLRVRRGLQRIAPRRPPAGVRC